MSGLMLHAGAKLVGRQNLRDIVTPEGTETHKPIPHHVLVETIAESLAYRKLDITRDEYAVSPDGMRVFGFVEVNIEHNGVRLALVFRNSHDRSCSLGLISGTRCFCCDNMAFHGEFIAVARKHTKNLNLAETVGIGVDRIQRHFQKVMADLDVWRGFELSDTRAKSIIYDALVRGNVDAPKHLAASVDDFYFNPKYPEFEPRTLYSLSNAFTSAFKELVPIRHMVANASLAKFMQTVD
jgi:hypothetical protein